MTADVRRQVRRYWWRYAVTVYCLVVVSAGVSVGLCVLHDVSRRGLVTTIVGAALLGASAYFATDHNATKPHVWLSSAGLFGVAALLLVLVPVYHLERPPDVALVLFAVGAMGVVGCAVTWHARLQAQELIGAPEIAELDLGTSFEARGNRATLDVDTERIMISKRRNQYRVARRRRLKPRYAVCRLENITSVGAELLARSDTHRLAGRRMVLMLTPGQAVRLGTRDGDWIFPTNRAYEACELIELRRKKHGRPNLGTFLPGDLP